MMSTNAGVDTATAAARRRQRRLRSWLKHERQTVAMELAAALHHSRDGERVTNYGLRAPKTASSGQRPSVLTEPEPQGRAVTVGCPGAVPVCAGLIRQGGRGGGLLLTAAALRQRKEEERQKELEEREEAQKRTDEEQSLLAVPRALRTPEQKRRIDEICAESLASRSSQLARRKRKKKLPRCTLPRQGCRRLCDHQRQAPTVSPVYSFMLPVQLLDMVFDMSVVVLRQVLGLMVQKTVVRPQLQSIEGRRLFLSFSRGSSSWSRLFTRPQRFFSCFSISGCRCPCCSGSCRFLRCCCGKDFGAPTVAARWEICALLRSSVFGSHSFGVCFRSTGFWTFLGDDIWERFRIQRVLVQHWIHVYVSLRRLLEDFHKISMSRWTSDLEVDAWCCSSYSAQCLVRQLLWEMTSWLFSYFVQCLVRHWIHGAASLCGHSTGVALGQACCARCVHDKCLGPAAHHSGGAAVAVPLHGRQHPRQCAETGSHGLTVQQTTEILLLQYMTGALAGPDNADSVGSTVGIVLDRRDMPAGASFFRAVYTGTRPGVPPPSGRGRVAGTPGACSQVFCHPIGCIVGTRLDRHAVL